MSEDHPGRVSLPGPADILSARGQNSPPAVGQIQYPEYPGGLTVLCSGQSPRTSTIILTVITIEFNGYPRMALFPRFSISASICSTVSLICWLACWRSSVDLPVLISRTLASPYLFQMSVVLPASRERVFTSERVIDPARQRTHRFFLIIGLRFAFYGHIPIERTAAWQ